MDANMNINQVSHPARTATSLATGLWDVRQKGVVLKEKDHIRRRSKRRETVRRKTRRKTRRRLIRWYKTSQTMDLNTLIHHSWPPTPLCLCILNSAGSLMAVLPPTYAKTDQHSS